MKDSAALGLFFLPNAKKMIDKCARFVGHRKTNKEMPPMKTLSISFFALAAMALAASAQSLVGVGSVKLGKVTVEAPTSPEYQVTGGPTKRSKNEKWLEFEVEYETKPDEIDELTFKFTALIEKKLLTGEVTYANILQGKSHFAVMYVSPKGIGRLTGGKPLTGAGIENVWVEVSRQGLILDKANFKPGNPPNAQQVTGLVLKKDDTPFAPLFFDRYEAIKQQR